MREGGAMERLYVINDALNVLAKEFNVRGQFAAGADAEYDEWMNDLTHVVAKAMGVDE